MTNDWYGINYPFSGGTQNVLTRQSGTRLVKNDILQLLYTNPGERVYRPDYGVGITMYAFDMNDDATMADLQTRIRNQMAQYETRVSIDSLDIQKDANNANQMKVMMVCSLIQYPDEKFSIDLKLPILEGTT
jgi:uncharacterized protein